MTLQEAKIIFYFFSNKQFNSWIDLLLKNMSLGEYLQGKPISTTNITGSGDTETHIVQFSESELLSCFYCIIKGHHSSSLKMIWGEEDSPIKQLFIKNKEDFTFINRFTRAILGRTGGKVISEYLILIPSGNLLNKLLKEKEAEPYSTYRKQQISALKRALDTQTATTKKTIIYNDDSNTQQSAESTPAELLITSEQIFFPRKRKSRKYNKEPQLTEEFFMGLEIFVESIDYELAEKEKSTRLKTNVFSPEEILSTDNKTELFKGFCFNR